jgi:hypothetical protein
MMIRNGFKKGKKKTQNTKKGFVSFSGNKSEAYYIVRKFS